LSALDQLPGPERALLRPCSQPDWIEPMLATLTDERFSRAGWLFERKLDGERCLAFRRGDSVRLVSRNRQPLAPTYPELVDALAAQPSGDFVVDGEIVAFEGRATSFARLQRRMQLRTPEQARASGVTVFLYLFDLLHLDGHDTTQLPLRRRKSLLRSAVAFDDPLRLTAHRDTEGETAFGQACRRGWEGLIAKRADAPYRPGRSTDWLKFKCVHEQEFVVGGYTEPHGRRIGLGALLVGYHDERGRLRYAGKVGTGFDDASLHELAARLATLEQDGPPFDGAGLPRRDVHWVRPELVAQIGFTEVTRDGRLRHPRFHGLRRDKAPAQVTLERPAA